MRERRFCKLQNVSSGRRERGLGDSLRERDEEPEDEESDSEESLDDIWEETPDSGFMGLLLVERSSSELLSDEEVSSLAVLLQLPMDLAYVG